METNLQSEMPFDQMSLSPEIMNGLKDAGYLNPTPIQSLIIPHIMEDRDVVGQAQTGTGKTAAFALPLLSKIDIRSHVTQVLVLAPTRELAIQVSESFTTYGKHLKGLKVAPIYGGQSYNIQYAQLKRGPHVVVGTPGRVMDHLRQGTLLLDKVRHLVLDEGDEMLRMGFIDDVEWIMEQMPAERQMALFSATMPAEIRKIARTYLTEPMEISAEMKVKTADTIEQRYWIVREQNKIEAMLHLLAVESYTAMLVFVRTKQATSELADKLVEKGFAAAPLNGDLTQAQRERTIAQLKNGMLTVVVATDVAARGLDVDKISHVINYDIPFDAESYIHRVGRTGRAGVKGSAILFANPREKKLLQEIERSTKQPITLYTAPTLEEVNAQRVEILKNQILHTAINSELTEYYPIVKSILAENAIGLKELTAAILSLMHQDKPLFLKNVPRFDEQFDNRKPLRGRERNNRFENRRSNRSFDRPERAQRGSRNDRSEHSDKFQRNEIDMNPYRLDVGAKHGVKASNIVGAIANETGLKSRYIGHIGIFEDYTMVDLPGEIPADIFQLLKKIRVAGRPLNISRA
ncbi:MAG TPA: DEAD/DEAH box helicase [Candidatus Marinimicrobia bacterium]|nr:DEAD/DEAH box helicase [Candidatus Neomarinimicrobiota bacterium]